MSMSRSVRLAVAAGVCGSLALAQAPTPDANALIPGSNLFRCATPTPGTLVGIDPPGDCSFSSTNPLPVYAPGDIIQIPVVVHVIQTASGTGYLSPQRVQSQIDVLNEDFRAKAGTPGAPGFDTGIEFQLATSDPNGNPTTGIVYHTNNTWFNDIGTYWNSIAWPTSSYLNIYTNNAGGGNVLGYVPALPQQIGGTLNTAADRVVILYSAFGRPGTLASYNQGRTATHEVGHYLGLFHTFEGGCSGSSCYGSGDRICDTNAEANPRFGCPGSAASCGTSDPFRNYMDYTDDVCMTNFTYEQALRMRCTLENWRPNLRASFAQAKAYGAGCYTQSESFQQTFGSGFLDLGGTAGTPNVIEFAPTPLGYVVQAGAPAWFAPTSADLGLGNDELTTINLPFTFDGPAGSVTSVQMCSNGFVYLDTTATATEPSPNLLLLAQGPGRFAPLWMDLDPSLSGSCHFDVDPSGNSVYFTWAGVAHTAAPTSSNSCQLVLHADGGVEYRYGVVNGQFGTCLVGFTSGGTPFVGGTDISAAMPFSVGTPLSPLTWNPVGRPVLGTTQQLTLGNPYDPSNSLGIAVLGYTQIASGLDLGSIGAPGCRLYASADVLELFLMSNGVFTWSLPIPSSTALEGISVFTQGALLTNSVNALGLLTANGVELVLGSN